MTSLQQQLAALKNTQKATSVAPNRPQPSLLLPTHTATSASHDIFFTMAVIAYAKLIKEQPNIKEEGETVMSTQNREINRNALLKDANRQLSEQLVRFMLKISPWFMNQSCQKILEYLLHNYKVNVFEAQPLAIIYLQYWNTKQYQKLISNIPPKILNMKLPFLQKINDKQPHNITFIVKSLAYSHFLIQSLVIYTLQFIRNQGKDVASMDIEVNVGQEYEQKQRESGLLMADPRRFLLQIFNEFLNRKMNNCYKYILEFCGKAVTNTKLSTSETCSMVMLLSTRMFIDGTISDQFLQALISKLIKNSKKDRSIQRGLFDFLMIVWQRKGYCLRKQTIDFLQQSQGFSLYLKQFRCSLWMVLIDLVQRCARGECYPNLLELIGHRVKKDEFYLQYREQFLKKMFEELEMCQEKGRPILAQYIGNHFQYQFAQNYNKKVIPETIKKILDKILPKESIKKSKNNELQLNFSHIKKQTTIQKEIPQQQIQPEQESDEEESIKNEQQEIQSKHSLKVLLERKGLKVSNIKYRDKVVREKLLEMVQEYYQKQGKSQLSQQQKNQVMEHFLQIYSNQYFAFDLKNKDFVLPIKYLTSHQDIQASKLSLNNLITSIDQINDVLYRQLFRLSLRQISASLNTNYKNVIYYLNTFFKKMINQHLNQSVQLLHLSEILLKVSEQTFGLLGVNRGKHQKILHNHGKLIADMIIGIKSKRNATKHIKMDEKGILQQYLKIVKIFGKDQLYLLNIGIIQILTRKQLDHSHIRYFISKLLLGGVRQGAYDFYEVISSLARIVLFCGQLKGCLQFEEGQIDATLSSGIAKKTIIEYFGLVKDKFKRVVIKKMLLFIRGIFQNSPFVQTFKLTLISMLPQDLQNLLLLFTQFYRILSMIKSQDQQVLSFRQTIINKIINLFPLDLKLVLFEPLMPDQHLYLYLGNQLEQHSVQKTHYQKLSELVNVVPQEVTFEWVKFIRQCMKRGNKPDPQLVSSVFAKLDENSNLNAFAQLICQFIEYYPDLIYEHLPLCIDIFQKYCEEPNDFTLALVSKMIKNLGEMVDPYLQKLLLSSLTVQSQYTQQFIKDVVEHLTISTLIKLTKQTHKKSQNFVNYSLWFKAVGEKGVGDSLNKILLHFLNRSLTTYIQNEQDPSQILQLNADIFASISLKMNQHQLRKFIIDLVRWSEVKSQVIEQLPFNYKKIAVAQIYCLMANKLSTLFTPFYGYIYQSFIKDLVSIKQNQDKIMSKTKQSQKQLKRQRQADTQSKDTLLELYLSLVLKSFELLFTNDTDHQFLDSVKIQALADPLIDVMSLAQLPKYTKLVGSYLSPCLIAFHSCIVDDYQMKTVNFKLLIFLKKKLPLLQRYVFQLYEGLVQSLQDRFLLLVSDLVPFLLQGVSSRSQGIAPSARRLIAKIQELSGEQISSYAK